MWDSIRSLFFRSAQSPPTVERTTALPQSQLNNNQIIYRSAAEHAYYQQQINAINSIIPRYYSSTDLCNIGIPLSYLKYDSFQIDPEATFKKQFQREDAAEFK